MSDDFIDWSNYDQVLGAVKNEAWNLFHATEKLRDDKIIVFEAVKKDGYVLQFASKRLRSDKTFMLKLLMLYKNDEENIYYIKNAMDEGLKKELNI